MNNKIVKFENPIRLNELSPKETLIRAGFKENMILCDIGAGTGIFSMPATLISSEITYALEISDDMISILENKKAENNLTNLKIIKVTSDVLPLDQDVCDFAIMVTVFHEIDDKEKMLSEIHRILNENGRLMIVEFHKEETPMGPPLDNRISREDVKATCVKNGFHVDNSFSLGENFYCVVFKRK